MQRGFRMYVKQNGYKYFQPMRDICSFVKSGQ